MLISVLQMLIYILSKIKWSDTLGMGLSLAFLNQMSSQSPQCVALLCEPKGQGQKREL